MHLFDLAGTWCRATVAMYAPRNRRHLIAYEDAGMRPVWVNFENKTCQVTEEVDPKEAPKAKAKGGGGGGSSSLPTSRQAALSTAQEGIGSDGGDSGGGGGDTCKHCRHSYTGLEPLRCRKCDFSVHHTCLSPPLDRRPPEHEAAEWICSSCVQCVGCGAERRAKADVGPQQTPSGTHDLCKDCTKLFCSRKHCPVCLVIWAQGGDSEATAEGVPVGDPVATEPLPVSSSSALATKEETKEGTKEESGLSCDKCRFWVHPRCDGLSEADYQV